MTTLAIFDLDGTIVPIPENCWSPENFNWENFLNVMDEQTAFGSVLSTLSWHLHMGHKVVVVTARPEHERGRTSKLLERVDFDHDELIMRPSSLIEEETIQLEGAKTSEDVKKILFNNHANWRKDIRESLITRGFSLGRSFAYDDQMPNLMTWREAGCSIWLVDNNGHLSGANCNEYKNQ